MADNVKQNQQRQKQNHVQRATERFFVVGDKVYALNHRGTPTWLPGTVSAVSGSRSLTIKFSDALLKKKARGVLGLRGVTAQGVLWHHTRVLS